MAQMGFFDLSDRYASLDAKKDPLAELDAVVPWEDFRPALELVWRKPEAERRSRAGRKPMDAVLMFKALILAALYNLSDDQIEYQFLDRLSFMRFLGLGLDGRVPDAKTVWLYREALAQAGMVEALFRQFDGHLARQGYIARGGQILDASIVRVPISRNTRDESEPANAIGSRERANAIKQGEVPEDWSDKPAKRSQKDTDARWTKKHGKSHFGYKNHVNVDRKHKLIRRYHVSDAALHDSQAVDHLLMPGNTGSGVWADAAYRSEEMEGKLLARDLKGHIHRKGRRGKPLGVRARGSNRTKSTVRSRVEHVFGAQSNDMGGTLVRTIGLMRARAKIGLKNLVYNMRRLGQLRRLNPNPPGSTANSGFRRVAPRRT
ncbi:IS5 family transposase [Poseidonocella sp. HB161398]|uniref:IS5 family transposase n=1 Tax=Poseidonocella sp. HB161398 TaxID=2320855 RepID=UPI001107F2EC|nr:IS5 family transposase [Poseidonocella sp. HB161398]